MTGDALKFTKFVKQKLDKVTFEDNSRRNILGIDKICKNSTNSINNVYLVGNLKNNLSSISQLCDQGNCSCLDGS